MLEALKNEVYQANMALVKHGLVTFTWGNVSGIDANRELIVIKPSGVPYDELSPEHMVVLDMQGKVVEGTLKPSSDTPTHLCLYQNYQGVGGVVHTHSTYATGFAQAGCAIPILGTTQADYFYGHIPCTRDLTAKEIAGDYEYNTGLLIVETFKEMNPSQVPGVLLKSHGPFAWGKDASDAVHNAVVLEEVAKMAFISLQLNPTVQSRAISREQVDKHYLRKHGAGAYYGQ